MSQDTADAADKAAEESAPVEEFHTEDVEDPAGPPVQVTLGGQTFTAECPKDVFWEQAAIKLGQAEAAEAALDELEGPRAALLASPRKRELRTIIDKSPPMEELRSVLTEFLFMCLSDEDEAVVRAMWTAKRGGVTSQDLYLEAMWLVREFEDHFVEKTKGLGLKFKERFGVAPPSREERRAARND